MRWNKKPITERMVNFLFSWAQASWLGWIQLLWQSGKKVKQLFLSKGLYEVLEYETTLELLDQKGEKAIVHKRQKVRYLQDNIIAYQDQAWGDGEILLNYQCSPGTLVDQYRFGHKTSILISLREVKNKGDKDEYNIRWEWRNGFLSKTGFWGTHINHRTHMVKVNVIFPKSRAPMRAWSTTSNRKRSKIIGSDSINRLPNGRWSISWERKNPKIFENYIMKWEW